MQLPPLVPGILLRRYRRFLADIRLAGGETVVAHCANTGSMLGLNVPGSRVWVSRADNPRRKLAWTWELVEARPGVAVGIHTGRANGLVEEALRAGLLPRLAGFSQFRREPRLGGKHRADLYLELATGPCHVEVKSVTAAVDGTVGFFPDAVSVRAARHLHELAARVTAGERAALVFCVQREDVTEVRPAEHIDPVFAGALREAVATGLEVYALGAEVSVTEAAAGIRLVRSLPVVLAAPASAG